ncbi:MAG: hypothetical protein EOP04_03620 [Proteobacteria bacterium]|nr:MAG: hypothetical protein EOP04_03620 [Pseudomonadota bacterium]
MILAKSSKFISNQFGKIASSLLPMKPADFTQLDGQRFSERIRYETDFEDDGRNLILLSDDAVGTMWEMKHLPHEILTESSLREKMEDVTYLFRMITSRRITFQVIFDQKVSDDFVRPQWNADTFARKAMRKRIKAIKQLAKDPGDRPHLIKRSYNVTLRIERLPRKLETESNLEAQLQKDADNLREAVLTLRDVARSFENMYLARFSETLKRCSTSDLVYFLRDTLHAEADKLGTFFEKEPLIFKDERISRQVLNGSISWDKDCVGVGRDTWEVISWSSQPTRIYPGLMTKILQVKGSVRCVVNIRPANFTDDLDSMSDDTRQGGNAYQENQKTQVAEAESRVVGGEIALHCSMHILIRNIDVSPTDDKDLRRGRSIARELSDTLTCFLEEFTAYPCFMVSLPFMASPKTDPFIARDRRIWSNEIGCLLPILGGTLGTKVPCQLMQARSGEAVWLNVRAGLTNPHLAIYGASQSGKSFSVANLMTSEFASDPNVMVFLIDSISSYRYLARAIGEDHGMRWVEPPGSYPNVFRGEITEARLTIITNIIKVAVSEICGATLNGPEVTLLGDAILANYEDNFKASQTAYVQSDNPLEVGRYEAGSGRMKLPRMTAIVNKLTIVAEKKDASDMVPKLREKLLPFYGSGPYSSIFDQDAEETPDAKAPGITVYELRHLSNDIRTIVTLIIIAEIDRLINHPANEGRKGMLVAEEAGVILNGKNPLLEDFIAKAWVTFAKMKISCVMVTNSIDHYINLSACKTAWAVSSNKLILPILAGNERKKLGEIISDPYYAEIAKSLTKMPGAYSEALWIGEAVNGTISFVPTGYDYWLAANHDDDTKAIDYAYSVHGKWQMAVHCLAEIAPMGFRSDLMTTRILNEDDKKKIQEFVYVEE